MRGELRGLSLRDHAIMILLGVVGLAGHQWLQAEGMLSADATTASWLAALAPAFMVILASFFLQERTTPGQVAGLGLALLGALLVAMRNEGLEIGRGDWVGPAFEFGDRMGCVFHCWKSCVKMLASSGCGIDYDLGLAIQPLFIAGQIRFPGSNCVPTRDMVVVDLPWRGLYGFGIRALFLCAFWKPGDDGCGIAIPRAADHANSRHHPS